MKKPKYLIPALAVLAITLVIVGTLLFISSRKDKGSVGDTRSAEEQQRAREEEANRLFDNRLGEVFERIEGKFVVPGERVAQEKLVNIELQDRNERNTRGDYILFFSDKEKGISYSVAYYMDAPNHSELKNTQEFPVLESMVSVSDTTVNGRFVKFVTVDGDGGATVVALESEGLKSADLSKLANNLLPLSSMTLKEKGLVD